MSEEEKDLINLKISISPEKYIKELLKENQQLKIEENVQKEMIENFIKENQELKKQQEEKTKIGISDHKYASKCEDKVITMENQQKEFIEYLEDWRKAVKKQYKELNEPVKKSFLKVTMDTIEEILSKYKKIIGGKE